LELVQRFGKPPKSWTVMRRAWPPSMGRSVRKCAEATTMARGRGRAAPSPSRKRPAGESSVASIGRAVGEENRGQAFDVHAVRVSPAPLDSKRALRVDAFHNAIEPGRHSARRNAPPPAARAPPTCGAHPWATSTTVPPSARSPTRRWRTSPTTSSITGSIPERPLIPRATCCSTHWPAPRWQWITRNA
jgi:hypothetical protein